MKIPIVIKIHSTVQIERGKLMIHSEAHSKCILIQTPLCICVEQVLNGGARGALESKVSDVRRVFETRGRTLHTGLFIYGDSPISSTVVALLSPTRWNIRIHFMRKNRQVMIVNILRVF